MLNENIRTIADSDARRFEWCVQNAISKDGMEVSSTRILIRKDKDRFGKEVEVPYYVAILTKSQEQNFIEERK